jgi:hypothetical protein
MFLIADPKFIQAIDGGIRATAQVRRTNINRAHAV